MSSLTAPSPRKTLSTNDWLVAGLFVVLVLIGLALLIQQILDGANAPDFSSRSDEPLGAEGLANWLETLGYGVDTTRVSPFEIPSTADVVIILEPQYISPGDYRAVNRWVNSGGTLLLAGQGRGIQEITSFQLGLTYDPLLPPLVWAESALVASPPQQDLAAARPQAYFAPMPPMRNTTLTLYAALNRPVVITALLGQGRIIASSTAYPFTNQGLTEQGNADLVLNLISLFPANATVWFDEYHHGDRIPTGNNALPDTPEAPDRTGPFNWLRYNATGQAFLYSGLVIFVALLLGGRALGRPLRPHAQRLRRPPLAYIQAIANLNRRAGHRAGVLQGYHQRLKRELGQRYRLSPALPDAEFVAELAKYNPGLDAAALLSLLQRLQNRQASEAELVQLASEVATWLKY